MTAAGTLAIATAVSMLALGVYDMAVRQPRTPRLAVVDIARLYESAERGARRQVLEDASTPDAAASGAARSPVEAARRSAEQFGREAERVLTELSGECRCAIVAMAAVIGGNSTVPDFTSEAAHRLGLEVRPSYASAR